LHPDLHAPRADARSGGQGWPAFGPPHQRREASLTAATSRSKDTDDVDFSTGSVGLGVAQTLFSSLVQDYVRAHGWGMDKPEGRMIALVGDAELDEGNIFEAMLEGWKQGLRNCWWIIDYNRQSLDAVIREGLWARYEALFRAFGWEVVILNTARCWRPHSRNQAGMRCESNTILGKQRAASALEAPAKQSDHPGHARGGRSRQSQPP
jgi:hypothetical protein